MNPAMNSRQLARWNAARRLFERLIAKAEFTGASLMFDGHIIQPNQIRISDDEIAVHDANCRWLLFQAQIEFDHGLYETIAEYRAKMKKRFKLIKEISW